MPPVADLTSLKVPASACLFASGPLSVQEITEKGEIPITLLARHGGPVDHWYWGKLVHDFSGMTVLGDSVPIDWEHGYDCSIGYLNKFDRGEDLVVSGALVPYPNDPQDKATEVAFKAARKVPYQASIDFAPALPDEWELEYIPSGMTAPVNGRQIEGPCVVFRKWTLHAVALCAHGADPYTEARFSSGDSPRSPVSVLVPKGLAMTLSTGAGAAPAATTPAAGLSGDNKSAETPAANPAQLTAGTTPTPPAAPPTAPTATQPAMFSADQLAKWKAEFGAENAIAWLSAGHDIGEARRLHAESLNTQLTAEREKVKGLEERLKSARVGEENHLSAGAEDVDGKAKPNPNDSPIDRLTAANEARLKAKTAPAAK